MRSINWSAAWAGLSIATATIVVLTALGAAFDISSMTGTKTAAPGAVWIGISLVVSMFAGGLATGAHQRGSSLTHALWNGLILWSLAVSGAVVILSLAGSPLIRFLRAGFIPQSATATGGFVALMSILMLGAAIGGALVVTLLMSRR